MSGIASLKQKINSGELDDCFARLYGESSDAICAQRERYVKALERFSELYPKCCDVCVFSAGGRTEICGNHTDHNFGKTLSAAVDLDVIAVVARDDVRLEVQSEGFSPDILTVDDIEYCQNEENSAKALIKGVCAGLKNRGFNFGGFVAYTTSNVLKGSGVSSSAAFEVLLVTVQNHLYNGGRIDAVTTAQISQYAENKYFGKPCGLLDQMSSAVGGFLTIDFENPAVPIIEKIDVDFASFEHTLCIVDTGGNHADLTCEYAAIPSEMKSVAAYFGKNVVREISKDQLVENLSDIREKLGDRAPLRALHFLNENERVTAQANALKSGDFDEFLSLVKKSGYSSFMYLQNVYTSLNTSEQGLSLALCLCDDILGKRGAYRVHGGGFGGTIQAFVPNDVLSEFVEKMEGVFGKGSCKILKVRKDGGIKVAD